MRGLSAGLLRARKALAPIPGAMIQQRACSIRGKPPKDKIGVLVGFSNTVFTSWRTSFTSSEWILKVTWPCPAANRVRADCDDLGRPRARWLDPFPLGRVQNSSLTAEALKALFTLVKSSMDAVQAAI